MKNWTADKVNGYGVYFRFILPIMVGIIGWFTIALINDIKGDVKELTFGFKNHLQHHQILEVNLGERLSSMETLLRGKIK